MCHFSVWPAQGSWNHRKPQYAPQPHQPDASDTSVVDGTSARPLSSLTPLQPVLNCHHHSISYRASLISLAKCSSFFVSVENSISLLMKVLPALMTLHACDNIPIRDKRSRFLQAFLPLQTAKSEVSRVSLSSGRRSSIATVSMSMPKRYARCRALVLCWLRREAQLVADLVHDCSVTCAFCQICTHGNKVIHIVEDV